MKKQPRKSERLFVTVVVFSMETSRIWLCDNTKSKFKCEHTNRHKIRDSMREFVPHIYDFN